MAPQTYKCGKDSDCGVDMSTDDPAADAMPHKEAPFPELEALSPEDLRDRMNFGHGGHKVAADRLFPDGGLDDSQQIPYEAPDHIPAMRRPCNLDRVLDLLASIAQDYSDENSHDAAFSTTSFNATLSTAKKAHQSAKEAVAEQEAARVANDTLFQLQAIVVSKATLIHDKMLTQADLIADDARLKRPIVQALGRIQAELMAALAEKQQSLDEFSTPPPRSQADRIRTLELHSKLIDNLRNQEDLQNKLAHDVLVPVQLNLNQTEQQLGRLEEELVRLQAEIDTLLPVAQTYSAEALASAHAVEADTGAHLSALVSAFEENLEENQKRAADRAANQETLRSMAAIIADVQMPRDPVDTYVNVTGATAHTLETAPLPPP